MARRPQQWPAGSGDVAGRRVRTTGDHAPTAEARFPPGTRRDQYNELQQENET